MKSSSRVGQRMTLKQKMRDDLRRERAGIEVENEGTAKDYLVKVPNASSNQVQSLSLSLLFSYNRFSPRIHPTGDLPFLVTRCN